MYLFSLKLGISITPILVASQTRFLSKKKSFTRIFSLLLKSKLYFLKLSITKKPSFVRAKNRFLSDELAGNSIFLISFNG
jgi:hypothetical protein